MYFVDDHPQCPRLLLMEAGTPWTLPWSSRMLDAVQGWAFGCALYLWEIWIWRSQARENPCRTALVLHQGDGSWQIFSAVNVTPFDAILRNPPPRSPNPTLSLGALYPVFLKGLMMCCGEIHRTEEVSHYSVRFLGGYF